MAVTWTRAVVARPCGYCVPRREVAVGERYLLIEEMGRQHVRCLECATTRWDQVAPPLEDGEDVTVTPATEPTFAERLFDWKQRAAGGE